GSPLPEPGKRSLHIVDPANRQHRGSARYPRVLGTISLRQSTRYPGCVDRESRNRATSSPAVRRPGFHRSQPSQCRGGPATALANRINIVLSYLNKILDRPGIEVRLHDTPLYNSIYRSDTTMLVNPHTYGSGAPFNPVMHLQQVPGGRVFDHYLQSFQRVWDAAEPVDRKSTRLNSSHVKITYAVFCLKKKKVT